MSIDAPSTDELIATLSKTTIPTVLVEGTHDAFVYRWIEERLNIRNCDVLQCGGRKAMLEIYRRRNEFQNAVVAFLADRDMWIFTTIPPEYEGVIWTQGYSIENDLYAGGPIESFLSATEKASHERLLDYICEWFAFEVEEYRTGNHNVPGTSIERVVPAGGGGLCRTFAKERNMRKPSLVTYNEIRKSYKMKLRGKALIQSIVRYLSARKRKSKYSSFNVQEISCKASENTFVEAISKQLEDALVLLGGEREGI